MRMEKAEENRPSGKQREASNHDATNQHQPNCSQCAVGLCADTAQKGRSISEMNQFQLVTNTTNKQQWRELYIFQEHSWKI